MLQIEVSEIVVHEACEPNALVDFLDAESLPRQHGRDIDLLAMQAEPSASRDENVAIVERTRAAHLQHQAPGEWSGRPRGQAGRLGATPSVAKPSNFGRDLNQRASRLGPQPQFHAFQCGFPGRCQTRSHGRSARMEIALKLSARMAMGGRSLIRVTATGYSLVCLNAEL